MSGRIKPFDVDILAVQNVESWNVCRIRTGTYPRHFKRHSCEVLTLSFQCPEDVGIFKARLLELQFKALRRWRPSPPSSSASMPFSRPPSDSRFMSHSRGSLDSRPVRGRGSTPDLAMPADASVSQAVPVCSTRSMLEAGTPSFQAAATVSEDPYGTGMLTEADSLSVTPTPHDPQSQPARQPTWLTGTSQGATNFRTVMEEPRHHGRLPSLRIQPGHPMSVTSHGFGEDTHPLPLRPFSSSASQAGSTRERFARWLLR
jgi:hypothetical protein